MRNKGPQQCSHVCAVGRVVLRRIYWEAADKQAGGCVLDVPLGIAVSTLSTGLRKLLCRVGLECRSFARATVVFKDLTGIRIGEEQLRQTVHQEAANVQKVSVQEELAPGWKAGDNKLTGTDGKVVSRCYESADGVMVPTTTQQTKDKRRRTVLAKRKAMPRERRRKLRPLSPVRKGSDNGYKAVYVTRLYSQDKSRTLVGVTHQGMPGLRRLLRRDASRVLLRGATERVGLTDGAVGLRHCLERQPLEVILLDFYHLSEHVAASCTAVYGEKSAGGKAWLAQTLHIVRHQGYEGFYERLLDWRGGLRGGKRKAVDKLIAYVVERREMIRYDLADAKGWDVGSGPIESQCGATTDRIKGRGRRWDLPNASGMMAMEALHQSDLWDSYWKTRLLPRN